MVHVLEHHVDATFVLVGGVRLRRREGERRVRVTAHATAQEPQREHKRPRRTRDTTISFIFTTLLCVSDLRILISRMAVMGKPSFSLSMRTFFSATISPVSRLLAMYTCQA